MTPAPNCCSGSSPPPTNAAAWPSPPTGPSTNGDGSYPNTPPPSASWTGSCTTQPSSSPPASPTACATPETPQEAAPPHPEPASGHGDFHLAKTGDRKLAIDTVPASISRRLVGITYVIVLLTAVVDLISDEYADLARVLIKAL